MKKAFNAPLLISILTEAATEWRSHSEELRRLDAIIGDGDMGVTVELGGKAIADFLANPGEDDIGKLLMKCGMQVNRACPSTFGTLLASAFMEAGKGVVGKKEIEAQDLAVLGKGAVEGVKKRGKAEVGDKTMLDSLVPAVEALEQVLASGADARAALATAVGAGRKGMEATVNMKAKYSRASYRPDGGVGVKDAGATAMYYLIEAFGKSLASRL